jgi:hypothetical protein
MDMIDLSRGGTPQRRGARDVIRRGDGRVTMASNR